MTDTVPDSLRDRYTPADVEIRLHAREPITDPTIGVAVERPAAPPGKNRLVVLGDSISHGFQSAAIFNTDLSYPSLIARQLGWYDSFRHPEYRAFGGLPLNLEYFAHHLESEFGASVPWWELALGLFYAHHLLVEIRDYWERGPGSQVPTTVGIMHNLAVSGYDIRDLLSCTADTERAAMQQPHDSLLHPLAANAGPLMSRYVLESARDSQGKALTPVEAARAHGEDGGIETLIVFIGANNALGTVLDLRVRWSDAGYDDPNVKQAYNVWRPTHFASEMTKLAAEVKNIKAQHVIWATVPHVTILPIARGVGGKMRPGSRYFGYYTRPWIEDDDFDQSVDPFLTGNEARAIDSAIDQYNDTIADTVRASRQAGLDWLLLDTAGLLDRLAIRRYILDPSAKPLWWTPYPLPAPIAALVPVPNTRFFATDATGRAAGGIFSLDGVHPTTIAYGVLAQEFIAVMEGAGVAFPSGGGMLPAAPNQVDFASLIARDTLISDPPKSVTPDMKMVGWANETLDWIKRMSNALKGVPT